MSQPKFEDLPETIRGRAAEQAISRWLQAEGWHILPAYDFSGKNGDKAPRFSGLRSSLIVPDLLGAKGLLRWYEVKWKHQASRGWTGIPLRHWHDYLEVRRISGVEVWLVFVHELEDEIRAGEIGQLAEQECPHPFDWWPTTLRVYDGNAMSYGGMALFCWECLTPLGKTSLLLGRP